MLSTMPKSFSNTSASEKIFPMRCCNYLMQRAINRSVREFALAREFEKVDKVSAAQLCQDTMSSAVYPPLYVAVVTQAGAGLSAPDWSRKPYLTNLRRNASRSILNSAAARD